jgi:hypothetical protein
MPGSSDHCKPYALISVQKCSTSGASARPCERLILCDERRQQCSALRHTPALGPSFVDSHAAAWTGSSPTTSAAETHSGSGRSLPDRTSSATRSCAACPDARGTLRAGASNGARRPRSRCRCGNEPSYRKPASWSVTVGSVHARHATLPIELDRDGQMVRERLALRVHEAAVDAPLARTERQRWRAPIEHAVDALQLRRALTRDGRRRQPGQGSRQGLMVTQHDRVAERGERQQP